jgi:hypothetical protein
MCTKIQAAAGINIMGMETGRLHQQINLPLQQLLPIVPPHHQDKVVAEAHPRRKFPVLPRIVQGAMLHQVDGAAEAVAVAAVAADGVEAAAALAAAVVVVLAEEGSIIPLSIYFRAIFF